MTREFDLKTEKFVEGGFELLEPAKTHVAYRTRDEVLIGTDFGADSLTDSGYPRVIKSWRRGTDLKEAQTVFSGDKTDVSASQYAYRDRGVAHEFQVRALTFYTSKYWYRAPDLSKPATDPTQPPFQEVGIPADATLTTFADQAIIRLRSDWAQVITFEAGSLLAVPLRDLLNGDLAKAQVLFEPTPNASLAATRAGPSSAR